MNIGEEIVSQLLEESTPIIALYPGKFKPPHAGHFDVVIKAAEIADKVIVIMSNVPKDEFTAEDSMKVWRLYEDLLPGNVQILISGKSSPVSEVFDIIKDKSTDFIVLYGKGEESRYRAIEKDPNTYPNIKVVDAGTFESLNATDLRTAIRNKDLEDIQKFLPKGIDAKKVLDVYTQNEFKPGPVLHESFTPQKAPLMKKFVEYACNELDIDEPKIHVINSPTYSQEYKSFGGYIPSEEKILVVVHNRNMADILRTLAHELVHHMQNLNGDELNGEDGSETENEANAMAGVLMREFGRENPEIFE
jgi:cytidyltransferase-like protein